MTNWPSKNATEEAATPQTARELDVVLRAKIEKLLNASAIWDFHSYGWVDAYNADPEFIGHAMWQTDPPFEWSIGLRGRTRTPSPQPTEAQQLLAEAGADFHGLMDAARMSIGLFLLQADATREFLFHDDKFLDLHYLSAVIYLATASKRIREFFIVAAFRVPQKTYQNGAYGDGKRSWYTTPFLEALDTLPKSSPDLADPLSKAYPLAEQIRELQDTRNALIHELATAIGRRERQLFQECPETVEREDFKFEDFQKFTKAAEARIEQQISDTIKRLAEWYTLLAKLSNEAFIVEHKRR